MAALKWPYRWRKRRNGARRASYRSRVGHENVVYPKDDIDRNRQVESGRTLPDIGAPENKGFPFGLRLIAAKWHLSYRGSHEIRADRCVAEYSRSR